MLRTTDERGQQTTMHDPYAFPPLLTDYDLHLLGEGRALEELQPARCATAHHRRRRGGEFRRLGAERHAASA